MGADVKYSSDIRIYNKKRIIDILRSGSKTKKQIADDLDISIATASNLCNFLIKEDYLISKSTESSEGGRIPQEFELKSNARYTLSLNLVEKDIITVAIVNIQGEIIVQKHIQSGHCKNKTELLLFSCESMEKLLNENEISQDHVLGIGIAVSGNEMAGNHIIRNCAANPIINNECIREDVEEYFPNIPVYIDNEANEAVLVLYQQEHQMDPGIEDAVYLYIGDGVGVGIVANGSLIKGSHGIGG